MKYKLVICDMDGILTTNHNISEYAKKVISEINKKGIFSLSQQVNHI